jgi:hypothetical protein
MATGAAQMRTLSRQLEKVPDEAVAALVRWFVPRSKQVGGRMLWFGRRVQLASKIKRRTKGRLANTVWLAGTPASCWSIKSYGRKGGYDVEPRRKEALSIKGFAPGVFFAHVTVHRAVNGDRRWDRLVAEADTRFPDVVADLVDAKVRL